MMRSGRHHHLAFYATGSDTCLTPRLVARGSDTPPTPAFGIVGVVELSPELAAVLLERHRPARGGVHRDAVEARGNVFGRRDLRHRPVVGAMPRLVLAGVAGAAGLRRNEAFVRQLNRASGDARFLDSALDSGHPSDAEPGRGDDERHEN